MKGSETSIQNIKFDTKIKKSKIDMLEWQSSVSQFDKEKGL